MLHHDRIIGHLFMLKVICMPSRGFVYGISTLFSRPAFVSRRPFDKCRFAVI